MNGNSPIGKLFRRNNKGIDSSLALDAVTYTLMHECNCITNPRLNVLVLSMIILDDLFIRNGQGQINPDDESNSIPFEEDYLEEDSEFEEEIDEESGTMVRAGFFSSNSPEYFAFLNKNLHNDFLKLEDNKEIIRTIQYGLENQYPPIVNALCEFVILQRGINLDTPSEPFGFVNIDPAHFVRFKECFNYGTMLSKIGINSSLIRFAKQLSQLEIVLGQIPSPEQLYIFHLGKCI